MTKRSVLLLCRHGETAANAEGRVQGCGLDPPLNAKGQQQARALGEVLQEVRIDAAFASVLQRARETAQAILDARTECPAAESGLEVVEDLKEMNYGSLEGKLLRDIADEIKRVSMAWEEGDREAACPGGGESPNEVFERAHRSLQEICKKQEPGSRLLFVTHSRLNKVLLSGLDEDSVGMQNIPQYNCCVNVLTFDHDSDRFEVRAVNLTEAEELKAHL
mmetsp:Transcript_26536/g.42487  ORF Transcript_26536/g.42487 Transcript_26536/m.42487 type:complete len:220 (-) Transcript_26536:187-846(-)|eukprot:CAMPEP_0171501092 /NCGR_PEP_ID=MMETSP0958-20121227/9366_1 /TAXON_ID=87120 /ORGANISM="Aurantiochytrium limacinum, Strain ATCCMYA-1381" /LENGTH=219 /DNA_ID=CAMNT_0012035869 /DNA_START=167 /DNA_END=826 /DNA_ORIENTATION=+